jgi:hypothetical protein
VRGEQFPTLAAGYEALATRRRPGHIPTPFVKSNTTAILPSG